MAEGVLPNFVPVSPSRVRTHFTRATLAVLALHLSSLVYFGNRKGDPSASLSAACITSCALGVSGTFRAELRRRARFD